MPRKRRTFAGMKRSSSAPADLHRAIIKRPKQRKGWQEESKTAALKAVKEGLLIFQAARDHGVPKITLYDWVNGKVTHGTNPGR